MWTGPACWRRSSSARVLSLAALEALAVEAAGLGRTRDKVGVLVVKRRAGTGRPTPRLVVLTENTWRILSARISDEQGRVPQGATT